MNFSKQYLSELSNKTNFIKDNLEKVLRLVEILKFLNNDNVFKEKLALKGGTAINLTAVELPRLSVDIDLDFAINLNKEKIVEVKEKLEKRIIDYMLQEGYFLSVNSKKHYALQSFVFSYINNAGNRDNIKIEINFMDRCHILPLEIQRLKSKGILEAVEILCLNVTELYASKINALISRATPRDLYDVYAMIDSNIIKDKVLLKKCLIFYNMISGNQDIDNLSYTNIEKLNFMKYKTQLKPVLSKGDTFNIEEAKVKVIDYIKELLVFDEDELDFINNFRCNLYMPNLLFDTRKNVFDILLHPMALWRCREEIKIDELPLKNIENNYDNIELFKFFGEQTIDNSNKNDLQKLFGKLLLEGLTEKLKQEKFIKIRQFVNAICETQTLKINLYNSNLDIDYKKESIFILDMVIQKFEQGKPLTLSEFNFIKELSKKI